MNKFKNSIAVFAKVASKSILLWFKLMGSGIIISFICSLIGFYLLSNNKGAFHGAGCGGIGAILGMFSELDEEFFSALLSYSLFIFIPVYFVVANKIVLFNAMYLTWENKSTEFVLPAISRYLKEINDKHAGSLKKIIDRTTLLKMLIDLCKSDGSLYKLQSKIVAYGLKKIHLDGVDFSDDNVNLPDEISRKIIQKISEITKPTLKLFWLITSAQGVLVILALIFDHK